MRATRTLRLVLVTVLAVAGLGVAAPASADEIDVTAQGVTFTKSRDTFERSIGYSIRSLEGWRYRWLTEEFSGRRGYVPFTSARQAMPDGYCVVYVRVPGAGEWHEHQGGARCTDATTESASPSAEPAAPEPTPTPTEAEPADDATDPAEATPEPEAAPTPSAPASPTPSASPSPTSSPTPTPSASPSPSPSPSPSIDQGPTSSPLSDSLSSSFSQELPEVGQRDRAAGVGPDITSDPWAMTGLILAVAGLGTAGLIVWRARRPDGS